MGLLINMFLKRSMPHKKVGLFVEVGRMRKVLNVLLEGRLIKTILGLVDQGIGYLSRAIIARITPVCNKSVIFMTYNKEYMCNPKYIIEEIIRQKLSWELYWVTNKKSPQSTIPNGVECVKYKTAAFYLKCFSSKIWVDNAINFTWLPLYKKNNQVYINTWHGSMGIKRIGSSDNKNRRWVRCAKKCGKKTDYVISNSQFEDGVYRNTYWPKTEILRFGHARNDPLFDEKKKEEARRKVHSSYNLSQGKRIIMYAPTFRDDGSFDWFNLSCKSVKQAMEQRFGGEWIIFIRYHFHDRNKTNYDELSQEYVIDVTDYPDMQELMLASDAGITDYSSWAYDYVFLRKPLFIYASDLEKYNSERGLYYKLETTPFPIADCNEALIHNICHFDETNYQKRIDAFLDDKGSVEDGQAAKRIVEKMKEIIGN